MLRLLPRATVNLSIVAIVGAMVALALVSWPMHDDFCNPLFVRDKGWLGHSIDFYLSWTGRLFNLLVSSLTFVFVPPFQMRWLNILFVSIFVGSVAIVVQLARVSHGMRTAAICALVAALVLGNIRLVPESVYWTTGGFFYGLPLFMGLVWLAALRWKLASSGGNDAATPRALLLLGWFVFSAATGNGLEVLSPALFLIGLGWTVLANLKREANLYWAGAGLLGLGAGATALLAAPGNFARAQHSTSSFTISLLDVVPALSGRIWAFSTAYGTTFSVAGLLCLAHYLWTASAGNDERRHPAPAWHRYDPFLFATAAIAAVLPTIFVPDFVWDRVGVGYVVFGIMAMLSLSGVIGSISQKFQFPKYLVHVRGSLPLLASILSAVWICYIAIPDVARGSHVREELY